MRVKLSDLTEQFGELVAIHSRAGERLYLFDDNTMITADLVEDDTIDNLVETMK